MNQFTKAAQLDLERFCMSEKRIIHSFVLLGSNIDIERTIATLSRCLILKMCTLNIKIKNKHIKNINGIIFS